MPDHRRTPPRQDGMRARPYSAATAADAERLGTAGADREGPGRAFRWVRRPAGPARCSCRAQLRDDPGAVPECDVTSPLSGLWQVPGMDYAAELKLLDGNPIRELKWKPSRTSGEVDRRRVINHAQARALLNAVRGQEPSGTRLVA